MTRYGLPLAIAALAVFAAPAEARHAECTWGVDVVVAPADPSDPVTVEHMGQILAVMGCRGPVVWATVVNPDGSRTFVPVYGTPPETYEGPSSSPTEAAPAESPRHRAKSPTRRCTARRAHASRKAKRCRAKARSKRAARAR